MNKVHGIGGSRAYSGSKSGPKRKQPAKQIKFSACEQRDSGQYWDGTSLLLDEFGVINSSDAY